MRKPRRSSQSSKKYVLQSVLRMPVYTEPSPCRTWEVSFHSPTESGCGLLYSFPERTSSVIWFTSDRLRRYARSSQGYHIKQTVRSSDSSNTTLARFVVCCSTQETDTRVGLILALLSFLVVVLLPAERIGRRWKVSLFNRFSSVSHIAIVSGFELLNSIRRHAGDLDFLLILDTATSRACPAVLVKTDVVLRIALPSSAKTWNKFLFLWHLNTSIWSWCLQFCRIHWRQ